VDFSAQRRKILLIGFVSAWVTILCFLVLAIFWQSSFPPEEIKISNQTESSLAISWVSQKPIRPTVYYSHQSINLAGLLLSKIFPFIFKPRFLTTSDDFGTISSTTHHVTLKNLEPETEYYYLIFSNLHFYIKDRNDRLFPAAETTSPPETISQPSPCYGKIMGFAEQLPDSPILVYILSQDSLISAYTNTAGNWSLDLANLRTKSLDSTLIVKAQGGQWGEKSLPLYIKECQPAQTLMLE